MRRALPAVTLALAIVLAVAVAVLVVSLVRVHAEFARAQERDSRIEARVCALEIADRNYDRALAAAIGLRIAIEPVKDGCQ